MFVSPVNTWEREWVFRVNEKIDENKAGEIQC